MITWCVYFIKKIFLSVCFYECFIVIINLSDREQYYPRKIIDLISDDLIGKKKQKCG